MTGREAFKPDGGERVPKRPEWLDDEREVRVILSAFLDKLDQKPLSERVRIPSVRLDKKTVPALYRNDGASDRTWALLRSLDGRVFDIRVSKKRQPYDPEYLGASLWFREESEAICRDWLGRPRQKRYQEEWASAVEARADAFADRGVSLSGRPVKVVGKSAREVVEAFANIGAFLNRKITLRQLSARVFWGHSKLLDSREDMLRQSYPGFVVAPRPVLVHVHLPQDCEGILFIENQDTYIHALDGEPNEVRGLALVYAAGFRGSAERIRGREGVSLHYQGASSRGSQEAFEGWWFDEQAWDRPVWFWGDLDYSGMAILKALRQRFGDIRAWQPGYAPMLKILREGGGHAPDAAEKIEQIDPGFTGCPYADEKLLPGMREGGRFIDQEAVR